MKPYQEELKNLLSLINNLDDSEFKRECLMTSRKIFNLIHVQNDMANFGISSHSSNDTEITRCLDWVKLLLEVSNGNKM